MEQGLLTDLYYDEILKVINEIRATERENILKAARMIADQVKQDKLVYVFGPGGHSNLAAMEVFFRAGGLMHISAILNQETMLSSGALKSMQTERLPGYGKIVVEDYGIGEGDLLWIVNAYGINSATIDAALTAKAHGAKVDLPGAQDRDALALEILLHLRDGELAAVEHAGRQHPARAGLFHRVGEVDELARAARGDDR